MVCVTTNKQFYWNKNTLKSMSTGTRNRHCPNPGFLLLYYYYLFCKVTIPHRPHLCVLWALWQHSGKAIPPTDTSSSTQAESHSPQRPLLPLLWALWQHSGSTATATPWQHRDGNTAKHGSARQNIRQEFFVRKRLPAAVFLQIFLSLLYNHH